MRGCRTLQHRTALPQATLTWQAVGAAQTIAVPWHEPSGWHRSFSVQRWPSLQLAPRFTPMPQAPAEQVAIWH